jgi:hypothetical protein
MHQSIRTTILIPGRMKEKRLFLLFFLFIICVLGNLTLSA